MEVKYSYLILTIIGIDAIAVNKRSKFTRVMRVIPKDHGMHTLSSITGISNHAICAQKCKSHDCLSFSYTNDTGRCELYSVLIEEEKYAGVSASTMYFSKVFNSCSDVPHGYPSGVYQITITKGNTVNMFCNMDIADGPWTVIQRRINGDLDFYRNWTEYKNGFGDLLENFWIGNDYLHLLTNTSRILRVEIQAWNGTRAYAQYSNFQVANENLNYKILVNGFSGNVPYDAMDHDNGNFFTTYDSDNDEDPNINCAVSRHSGWWHKKCTRANLNGKYQYEGERKESIYWVNFPDDLVYFSPLRMTMMMIR